MRVGLMLLTVVALAHAADSQTLATESADAPEPAAPAPVAAAPADVASPEAIVRAVHRSISGPAVAHFDFGRFRSLFLDDGKVGAAGQETRAEPPHIMYKSVTAWIGENQEARNRIALDEKIIAMRVSRFGNIASVFYTHNVEVTDGGKTTRYQTANVAQLVFDGRRWWVASLIWNVSPDPDTLPDGLEGKDPSAGS